MTKDEMCLCCPFCEVGVEFGDGPDGDPDAAFSELLGHIRRWHPGEDQTPAVLWPKIEVGS